MPEQEVAPLEVPEAAPVPAAESPAPDADVEKTVPEKTPEEVAAEAKADEQKKLSRRERQRQRDRETHIAERAALEAENRLLKEQLHGKAQPQQKVDVGPPKREDFEDFELFLEAKAEYKAAQIVEAELKKDREARQSKERESTAAETEAKRTASWNKREAEYAKGNPDYEERAKEFLDSGAMEDIHLDARKSLIESDQGPALLDYLATHPDDVERIAQLNPLRQIAELGKLEIKLEKAPPKPSDAPAPAKPIATARSSGKDITKMSAKEIEADMKARGSRWVR